MIGFIRNETGYFYRLRQDGSARTAAPGRQRQDGSATMGPTDADRLHRLWYGLRHQPSTPTPEKPLLRARE